jgi:hypothetical protein
MTAAPVRKTLRATFGAAVAVAALAAALTACDGSGYAADEFGGDEVGVLDTSSGSDISSESDTGSVIFNDDGGSLTTLPDGGISFSSGDVSFSSGG